MPDYVPPRHTGHIPCGGPRRGQSRSIVRGVADGTVRTEGARTDRGGAWNMHRRSAEWVMEARRAKFGIGQVVRHRRYPFRGVIYDVDPVFANTEEWWQAIPEDMRPVKDQPFYHLFAENSETEYVAYVSEQNLLPDKSPEPLRHPQIDEVFDRRDDGSYQVKTQPGH